MSTGEKRLPRSVVLELENLQLKLSNVQLQLQLMNRDLAVAVDSKNKLQRAMEGLRTQVMQDYGVDVTSGGNISIDDTVKPLYDRE